MSQSSENKNPVICLWPTHVLWVVIKHDLILCCQHLFKFMLGCICFLWLLSQITTNLVSSHHRKLLCHNSRGRKSEIKASTELGGVCGTTRPMPLPELLVAASTLGSPWLGDTSLQCLPLCPRGFFPVSCVYFPFLPLFSLLPCHCIPGPP